MGPKAGGSGGWVEIGYIFLMCWKVALDPESGDMPWQLAMLVGTLEAQSCFQVSKLLPELILHMPDNMCKNAWLTDVCKYENLFVILGVCLRKMLYDLSEGISAETLNSMKFLLGGSLPKSEMVSASWRWGLCSTVLLGSDSEEAGRGFHGGFFLTVCRLTRVKISVLLDGPGLYTLSPTQSVVWANDRSALGFCLLTCQIVLGVLLGLLG